MENFSDKGSTDSISSCNSSHTAFEIFFHSPQYKAKTRLSPSGHWFLDIRWLEYLYSFKLILYPLKACDIF
jgi:hypothetical protein